MTAPVLFLHFIHCIATAGSYRRDGLTEQAECWHQGAIDTYAQMSPADQERARVEYQRLTGQEWTAANG